MAQARRQAPTETTRSILLDALVERGYNRQEATQILSIASTLRRRGAEPRELDRAMASYMHLSPSASRDVCDIMGRWNEVAMNAGSVADLTPQQARQISSRIREPTPLSEFMSNGFRLMTEHAAENSSPGVRDFYWGAREMFRFMYLYYHEGVSFEDAARQVGSITPKRR